MIIDAHTHRQNLIHPSVVMGTHAVGIHPWELDKTIPLIDWFERFKKIENQASAFLMIGECGIDRVRPGILPVEDQKTILEWHLKLAFEQKKPVVIHCVRAHSDLIGIFKRTRPLPVILLHDFSGNQFQIKEYLRYPVTFSVGRKIMRDNGLIERIPLERLLLETDDQQEVTIDELYKKAAEILKLNDKEFETQLGKNFLQMFGHENDVRSSDFIKNFNSRL